MYAYRASKTALNMEWRSLSGRHRRPRLICVVLHPGWVRTDMGGSAAPITIDQSVPAMVRVIDGLAPADNAASSTTTARRSSGEPPPHMNGRRYESSMLLTEEQILIRDTARAFAREQVLPHVRAWEAAGEIPRPLLAEMGRLGFMGMTVPAEWGGAGARHGVLRAGAGGIAAADGGLSTVMSVNNSPDCAALLGLRLDRAEGEMAEAAGQGRDPGRFCLTEPQAGSDASNLRTRAERRGNGWVLNGVEAVHHLGRPPDMALVFAGDRRRQRQARHLLLHRADRTPGYRVASIERKLGQKSSDTVPDRVRGLPGRRRCHAGGEGEGYRHCAGRTSSVGTHRNRAQAVGMARAALRSGARLCRRARAFRTKIINHQAVQFRLGRYGHKVTVRGRWCCMRDS
jgi:alkylation response protein AidB-like acyl-CoA dehydrogenase